MKLHDKSALPPGSVDETVVRNKLQLLVAEIGEYQLKLYAEAKRSMLVIFQGMDASGKDGAIKDVFEAVNPMGCRVYCFKKPTEMELAHDYLWRIHALTPEAGMIHVFNRSHYEDILIPSVEGYVPKKDIAKRFGHINDFERMLADNGTTVLKFFLHVSRKEQEERLKERMTNPKKFWKHKDADWDTRRKWEAYMKIYETLFRKCNVVPWHIIPSDKNWYKEYLVAGVVLDALKKINPKYPPLSTKMKAR
jgi:PPK2 family polyphosphate:nucleotide phosphotransferase